MVFSNELSTIHEGRGALVNGIFEMELSTIHEGRGPSRMVFSK